MKELSLHILDIVENSISAQANTIDILVSEHSAADLLQISIKDDGKGMDAETVEKLTDPFFTSRTTRRVGMGLPLLKNAAEDCNGSLTIQSSPGLGTEVQVTFQNSHIDRMPMGDLTGTILALLVGSPEISWHVCYCLDEDCFKLDSVEIQAVLGEIPLSNPDVLTWLREYIQEGILEIQKVRN